MKIPVTNTRQEPSTGLIRMLSGKGIPLNLTAILTLDQVREVVDSLDTETPSIVSIFAGRIADTGVDPIPLMKTAAEIVKAKPKAELLWASSRELLNIFQADRVGCDIITVTKCTKLFGRSPVTTGLRPDDWRASLLDFRPLSF